METERPRSKSAELEIMDNKNKRILADFLHDQLGKPYKFANHHENHEAFDCSGLIKSAYKKIGLDIARTTINQATFWGRALKLEENYEIGDLLFFRGEEGYFNQLYPSGIGHVAIYSGNGNIIHSVDGDERTGVLEENLDNFVSRRADANGESDLVVAKRIFEHGIYYHEGQAINLVNINQNSKDNLHPRSPLKDWFYPGEIRDTIECIDQAKRPTEFDPLSIVDPSVNVEEEAIERANMLVFLRSITGENKSFKPRDTYIILARYGFLGEERSLESIASELGVSRQAVQQKEERLLKRLKAIIEYREKKAEVLLNSRRRMVVK